MALPIDEGPIGFTTRVGSAFTVTNAATELRVYRWQPALDDSEEDYAIVATGASKIYDNTTITVPGGVGGAGELAKNLHMVNGLTYGDQAFNKALLDIIVHQAHVGRLPKRLLPNGDAGVNQWIPSSGSSPHYQYIDEKFDDPALGNFLFASSVNQLEKFELEPVPSNVVRVHELLAMAHIAITVGTDTGMAIEIKLTNSSDTIIGRAQLLDCEIDGSATAKRITRKLDRLDTTAAVFNAARLHITSRRGAAGGTPSPLWYLFQLEIIAYCEINDIEVVNQGSFTAHDSAYAAELMRFSESSGDFNNLVLDLLSHRAEAYLYVDYLSRLSFGRLVSFASVSNPIDISSWITGVKSSGRYKERAANEVMMKWGVNTAPATGAEDPVNTPDDRGVRRIQRGAPVVAANGYVDAKELDRHYFSGGSNAGAVKRSADAYLDVWGGDGCDYFEPECKMRAIELEPGDVVYVNRPDLGINGRKYTVVSKAINRDDARVEPVLYDIEYTL